MRAAVRASAASLLAWALALAGCDFVGRPPDDVPFVKTGGSGRATQMEGDVVVGAPPTTDDGDGAAPDGGVQGTLPSAGRGNDLTGGGGFEARADSDFVGLDELDDFDDFRDIEGFDELDDFGAGFTTPSTPGTATNAF